MRGFFVPIFLGLLAGVCQVAITPFFVGYKDIGVVLPCLVLFVMSVRISRSLAFAVTAGMVLDSYVLIHPSFLLLRLLALGGLTYIVFSRWLTNRSVYTALVLAALASLVDSIFSFFIALAQGVPFQLAWSLRGTLLSLFVHMVASFIGFTLIMSLPRRVRFPSGIDTSSRWYG